VYQLEFQVEFQVCWIQGDMPLSCTVWQKCSYSRASWRHSMKIQIWMF